VQFGCGKCAKKSEKKKASCGGAAMRKRLLIKNFVAQMLDQERQMTKSGREQLSREVNIPEKNNQTNSHHQKKPIFGSSVINEDDMDEGLDVEEVVEEEDEFTSQFHDNHHTGLSLSPPSDEDGEETVSDEDEEEEDDNGVVVAPAWHDDPHTDLFMLERSSESVVTTNVPFYDYNSGISSTQSSYHHHSATELYNNSHSVTEHHHHQYMISSSAVGTDLPNHHHDLTTTAQLPDNFMDEPEPVSAQNSTSSNGTYAELQTTKASVTTGTSLQTVNHHYRTDTRYDSN